MSKYLIKEIKVVFILWIFLLVITLLAVVLYNTYSAGAILKIKSLDQSPNTQTKLLIIEGDKYVRELAGLVNNADDFNNQKVQQIFNKAYESYYRAFELSSWNLDLYKKLADLYKLKEDEINQHYWLCLRAIEAKQFKEVRSELAELEKIDSSNPNVKFLWGRYLLSQGMQMNSLGKKSEAQNNYLKALDYFAETREIGRLMCESIAYSGICKNMLGNTNGAIEDLKIALINNPEDDSVVKLLSSLLFQKGETSKAIKLLEVFLQNESNFYKINIRHALAKYYFDVGEHDKAIKQMELSVKHNRNNPVLYNDLAEMYTKMGDSQKAMESLANALKHSK